MKLIQTLELTEEEKEKFFEFYKKVRLPIDDGPCSCIDCGTLSCDVCPFSALQDRFTEFQRQLAIVKRMIKNEKN